VDAARFCVNCGQPMVKACANCGTELPATARFCHNCGRPQAAVKPIARTTANPTFSAGEATALLTNARSLTHTTGERAAEARILWNLLLLSTLEGGDPEERLRFGLEGLAIARALELSDLIPILLHDLWYAYGGMGRWLPWRKEALPGSHRRPTILAESLTRRSYTHIVLGEYQAALPLAEESYQLGELTANIEGMSISRSFIGLVYLDRGDIDRGLALMEEAVELGRQVGGATALLGAQGELGWLGDIERGRTVTQAAVEFAERHMANLIGWALAPAARLHLLAEDAIIHMFLKGEPPLFESTWAGRTGASLPQMRATTEWVHAVRVDVPTVHAYARAVADSAEMMVAWLSADDLARTLDLSAQGLGHRTVSWIFNALIIGHLNNMAGEISCLKGLQGAKGYPF